MYDPIANNFTNVGNMMDGRFLFAAVRLSYPFELILSAGGYDNIGATNSSEIWSETEGSQSIPSMIYSRFYPIGVALSINSVIVIGGYDNNNDVLNNAEIFEIPISTTGIETTGKINTSSTSQKSTTTSSSSSSSTNKGTTTTSSSSGSNSSNGNTSSTGTSTQGNQNNGFSSNQQISIYLIFVFISLLLLFN